MEPPFPRNYKEYADVHRMDTPKAFDMPYFVSAPNSLLRRGVDENYKRKVFDQFPTQTQAIPAEPINMHRHWTMGMINNHAFQTFLPKVSKKVRKTSVKTYEHGVNPQAKSSRM